MVEVTPDWKPASTRKAVRRSKAEQRAAETFKQVVCADGCVVDGRGFGWCELPLQAAHVVSKETLRERGLGHLVYDPVNAVCLCYRHHRRHDNWTEKLPRHLLPARCFAWATAHGVLDALERQWPA